MYMSTKYVHNLYEKNYRALMNEIKEEINKCTFFYFHDRNIVKMSAIPNLIYRFDRTPIKKSQSFCYFHIIIKLFWITNLF